MGFFSLKETCSCCGGETGFNKYKCKGGYLCPKCFSLLRATDKSAIIFKLTGKEVNEIIGQNNCCSECGIHLEKDFKKLDNQVLCKTCYTNKKLQNKEDTKNELIDLQNKAKNFKSTSNVEKYIYFNDDIQEIYIPDFWARPKFIKYNEILDFELLEDGNSVSSGGVGRAVAGGVLFGGAGAIVGGVTGKKKSTNIATSMQIKITTRDINNPVIFIKIFKGEHKKGSFMYNSFQKNAHSIISMLQIAVDKINQTSSNTSTLIQETSKSKVDELKELKDLLDSGILTQEEFNSEKTKVLNR